MATMGHTIFVADLGYLFSASWRIFALKNLKSRQKVVITRILFLALLFLREWLQCWFFGIEMVSCLCQNALLFEKKTVGRRNELTQ